MKTVNIKGKEYVEVNERVKFFRNEDDFKGWSIDTELLSNENGVCIFKAVIKDVNGVVKSTGHAYEKEDSTYINKTSYIENCETSAVGRALGMLGIGIDASIASSDEVQNAMDNQPEEPKQPTRVKTQSGVDFNEARNRYSKMTKIELRKEYVMVNMSKHYSDKQREALLNMIKKAQETAKE